ncbi:MAG: hypothetical protein KDE14_02995 [Rhodobacteraceae bacterium]|nr:hypothetical protein [Paracoccaceae bacterium]
MTAGFNNHGGMARGMMAAMAAILIGLTPFSASADGIRAAARDDYGRLVFDWDQPIRYAADVVGGNLVVQFERAVTGDIAAAAGTLGAYVMPGRLSADRRTITFPLRANVAMRTFTVGNAVVVDLSGAQPAAQQPAAATSASPALLRPAPQTPVQAPARPATPAASVGAVGTVPVRTGVHPEYFRIVFDWPVSTPFTVERLGDRTAIAFNGTGTIDVDGLRRRLPAASANAGVRQENGQTIVTIPVAPNIEVRNFTNGNSVVIDLMTSDSAPAQTAATAQAPAPARPAPPQRVTENAPPAATQTATPPPPPPRPSRSAATRELSAAVQALTGPNAEQVEVDASGQRVTRAAAGDNRPVDPLTGRPAEVSLTIPFEEPAAAAVFRRSDYLWVVFDRYQQVDVDKLAKEGAPYITLVEQLPYRTNTIIRMVTQPDINPSMRRDGLDWTLDFRSLPLRPTRALEVVPQIERAEPNLYIPVTEAGRTVAFEDPEVGDYLLVIPVIPLGYGISPERTFPDVELPVTAQGVVVAPRSDGVRALATRSGIDIDVDGGMAISKVAAEQLGAQAKEADLNRILNLSDWQIGREEDYVRNKQAMQNAIADASASAKQEARLRMARFEFINGYYPEVLGILRVVQSTEPEIENTGSFRALRGATNMMMRRYKEAAEDFSHFSLANEEDARYWLAAAQEKMENDGAHAQTLIQTGSVIRAYPRSVKIPLAIIGAEAAIAAGDDFGAQGFLELLRRERPKPNEQAAIDYLDGRLNEKIGELRVALEQYSKAENGSSLLYNVLGLRDRMELEYKLGTATIDELIETYEKLRYRWRGDEIELGFLLRLADLHREKNDYGQALRVLKLATQYFRDFPAADRAAKQMADIFEELYLNGGADKLAPVTAVALFDEFRALLPPGEKGDEMIRKLADRLVSIDLLDQAALLLERQVQFRVTGIEKSRIGSRLALVYLLNREPEKAIQTLTDTMVPDAPADLQAQRRRLEARALTDLGRTDDAILLLGADTTDETKQLRAEIYWRSQNWSDAAKAIADMVPEPGAGSLSDANARLLLDWVTALTLAKEDRTIMRVRQRYLASMMNTPYRDAFDLITAEREDGIDPAAIRRQIEQAQNFKSFLVEYKDMIGDKSLSAIN